MTRSSSRRPRLAALICAIGAPLCMLVVTAGAVPGRLIEGPSSDDFPGLDTAAPRPEIAVGPDDVLTIVNRRLSRLPNPNASGRGAATDPDAQSIHLDAWLGATALGQLCPTAPRTSASCVVDHASVRYDQMHGRFLVLFTVTDTGLVSSIVASPRKASWVLAVSHFPVVSPRTAGAADTQVFVTPGVEGPNPNRWNVWSGDALNGLGTDGFGNPASPGGVGVGNLNALPGITGATAVFDCRPSAIAAAGVTPTSVCYFPTGARLGIDNETITIASPVLNMNVNPADLSTTYDPPSTPAFAGTRLRVIKKSVLYTRTPLDRTLTAGNQFDAAEANRFGGSYYDLYTTPNGLGAPVTTPLVPFTALLDTTVPANGAALTPPGAASALAPLFYEPAQLRGVPQASFANPPSLAAGDTQSSQTYLVGTVATPFGSYTGPGTLWVQRIQHVLPDTGVPASGPLSFYPVLATGDDAVTDDPDTRHGLPAAVQVGAFTDPGPVDQGAERNDTPAPFLYVGDARPQRLIFREGNLYDARVGAVPNGVTFNGNPLVSTVFQDVLLKPLPDAPALPAITLYWANTRAYAPMYDVPANVATAGNLSPIHLLPFLEKLFVGTTLPPLVPTRRTNDPRLFDSTGERIPDFRCVDRRRPPDADAWPGLFDVRCGEDPYDATSTVVDPATGIATVQIPFGLSGGASTDPNNGSLWLYGAYARRRLATVAQWGTTIANYDLTFPTVDPYGNEPVSYLDVPPTDRKGRATTLFLGVQKLAQHGVTVPGDRFFPKAQVTREEMALAVVRSLMDESAITDYLNKTGGAVSSFADVAVANPNWRYVEVMYRRGYTQGCSANLFCPTNKVTRGEMAVFIIRAKMGNVFPSVLTGCTPGVPIQSCGAGGDNFGLFVSREPFYKDNLDVAANPFYAYVQLMQSLRIDGESKLKKDGLNGKFKPEKDLTRGQLMTFLVRAFFL